MARSALRKAASAEVPPPPPEERAVPFVSRPNSKAIDRINREMRQRMYLMGKRMIGDERNPSGVEFYVMGKIGKTFTVKIREFPCCQCGDFLLSRLCKHMVFVSSRVLKLNQDDPLIWQRALVPSELKKVIENPAITPVKPKSKFQRLKESFSMGYGPHDILQHDPMYCPVCCEEVNFFEEEVYEREESLLEELYTQNSDQKVTQVKAKLDMGTPKSMLNKQKKPPTPPPEAAPAPPPPSPPPPAPPADSALSPVPEEGAALGEEPKEGEEAEGGGETAEAEGAALPSAPPAPGAEEGAAATVTATEGEAKREEEEAKQPDEEGGPAEPQRLKPFEPLLFCPQKRCEVEGCVKVVHHLCWLKWNRFHRVDWRLPKIFLVNNTFPLASVCH